MSGPRILVVGASNMDLVSYVTKLPEKGETILGKSFETVRDRSRLSAVPRISLLVVPGFHTLSPLSPVIQY